jgi:DNA-binding MarR family transcriptional regulator
MREFVAEDSWTEITQHEYDVLYTLSKAPGGLSLAEANRETLMTQGGLSKLVSRLVERGLIARCADESDRRSVRLRLTEDGRDMQRLVGRRHARSVAEAMRRALTPAQMEHLLELGSTIIANIAEPAPTSLHNPLPSPHPSRKDNS